MIDCGKKNAGRWLGRPGQLQSVRAGEGLWQWRSSFLVPRQLVRAIASTSRCINTTKLHSLKKLPLSQSTQAQRALARGPAHTFFRDILFVVKRGHGGNRLEY